MTPKTTFIKNNKKMTYADYFLRFYGIKVQDLTQPLICVETHRSIRMRRQAKNLDFS